MAEIETVAHEGAETSGSFLTRKVWVLPVWAWALLILIGAYLYSRRTSAAGDTSTSDESTLPSDVTPELVIQNYITGTNPSTPPVGGSSGPPATSPPATTTTPPPAKTTPPPATTPPTKTEPQVPGKPAPTPVKANPIKTTTPAKPAPATTTTKVTVSKYTTKNPPWNSTLSGIASHEGFGSDWEKIWNSPANAQLKARRKEPNLIQPGDVIVIPSK